MSMRFDPYHAWLGIPPNEQPPNHYRLLGITRFESDEEVIQNGLDQRLAHLKSFLSGPNSHDSERLLREVSRAGACLLRPEKKQVYDRRLRFTLNANAETVVRAAPIPPSASPASPVSPPPSQPVRHAPPPHEVGAPMLAREDPRLGEQAANQGFPVVPTIVGSVIGLGVACLVLILLLPGRSSSNRVVQLNAPVQIGEDPADPAEAPDGDGMPETTLDPEGQEQGETTPAVEPSADVEEKMPPAEPAPGAVAGLPANGPFPSGNLPQMSPMSSQSRPTGTPSPLSGNLPPASLPRTLPGSPAPSSKQAADPFSNPFPLETVPATPSAPVGTLGASSTITGTPKSIVLDLERSSMHVKLVENAEGKEVQVQVQGLTNLSTPYHTQPFDGIATLEQSVDIVFTEYAGVKIRLAVHRRGKGIELEIAPEIETGEGKASDFSKRKLDNVKRAMTKDGNTLSKQLAAAQSEAMALQNVMSRPAPATVRNVQKRRYNALRAQIPVLQNQLTYIQARKDVLQQLSLLAKRMHEKAGLNLVVQVKPAAKAE